jgi:hypothetical protein
MATEVSNIDDLLMGGNSPSIPATPESRYEEQEETPDTSYGDIESPNSDESHDDHTSKPEELESSEESPEDNHKKEDDYDDYGNTKTPPRTYTEEEVNEMFRKRNKNKPLEEQEYLKQQMNLPQVAKDFEYNPDSEENWESQLEKFVEKTVSKLGQKQAQQQQQARDEQVQAEFEDKFNRGMNRFSDFRDVVGSQPVTDPMTYALRGLPDPAAFIYAASKRHPQELSRISQIQDPAAQIMEMGRLEERMRKAAPGTKAPRPISKSREDSSLPVKGKKTEPSIEDLIAKADAKRKQQLNQKRGR